MVRKALTEASAAGLIPHLDLMKEAQYHGRHGRNRKTFQNGEIFIGALAALFVLGAGLNAYRQ